MVTLCTKLVELYYDVSVKFSPILEETFGQITTKYQIRISQLSLGARV